MTTPRKKTRAKASKQPSFEESLARLQEIVARLEEGDLPLLESIEHYREGIEALRTCRSLLDEARKSVEILAREVSLEEELEEGAGAGEGDEGIES